MKKYFIAISSLFLPLIALAHSAHYEENPSTTYWFEDLLPFKYLENGNWFIAILCILFWAVLIYIIYLLVNKFRK
jgi:hypothetical protein